jgi:hypothetical protein
MTVRTNPTISTHHFMTTLVTVAVSVGLTIGSILGFATTKAFAPITHLSRADSTRRGEFPPPQIAAIMRQNPTAYVYAGSSHQTARQLVPGASLGGKTPHR